MTNPEAAPNVADMMVSLDGNPFERGAMVWHLNRDIQVRLSGLWEKLEATTFSSACKVLEHFACNYSAAHTSNMCNEYLRLLRFAQGQPVSADVIARYHMMLGDKAWRLLPVRAFMTRWRDLGYDGLDLEALGFLEQLSIKGNPKGEAVKSLDPSIGPLSDIELLGINETMTQAYEAGKTDITDLAMGLLLSAFGIRSVQLTTLRGEDIVDSKNKRGDPIYAILIPRAKQFGEGFRSSFKKRSLTRDIWDVLEQQKSFVQEQFVNLLGWACPDKLRNKLPLFPNWAKVSEISNTVDLLEALHTDRLHLPSRGVNYSLKRIMQKFVIHSERTGEPLRLSSRRFRYTLGSRAAREGCGPLVIAELLDHSDLQNVAVYTENLPEFAAHLDETLTQQLAPYAKAFTGTVVNSQTEATRGNDPTSQIRDHSGQGTGNCGYHGPCGANVPIPCYTCTHFEAWVTGPHKAVHDHLLSERDRLIQLTSDTTIAAALDRSILAVAQVITVCEAQLRGTLTADEDH